MHALQVTLRVPVHNFLLENVRAEGRRRRAAKAEDEDDDDEDDDEVDSGLVGEWSEDRAVKVGRLLGSHHGEKAGTPGAASAPAPAQGAGPEPEGAEADRADRAMATKIEEQTYTLEVGGIGACMQGSPRSRP